jgi:hypothetical protein
MIGDCFTCVKASRCTITNSTKIIEEFTCELFEPVPEPVYHARLYIRTYFGELAAAQAILNQGVKQRGEPNDVNS